MKRKLRLSALIVLAVLMLSLLIGGLYGYFQDTETSTGNVFTAGTLNLVSEIAGSGTSEVVTVNEQADGANDNVTFGMVAPGDSGSISWTLTNDGNLDGTLAVVSTASFADNGDNEPERAVPGNNGGGNGDLDQYMDVWLYRDDSGVITDILGTSGAFVAASGLDGALDLENLTLGASGGQTKYVLEWHIDTTVGNVIQSDTATFNVTFTLAQIP